MSKREITHINLVGGSSAASSKRTARPKSRKASKSVTTKARDVARSSR